MKHGNESLKLIITGPTNVGSFYPHKNERRLHMFPGKRILFIHFIITCLSFIYNRRYSELIRIKVQRGRKNCVYTSHNNIENNPSSQMYRNRDE
jgi:hypothetical protein